MNSQKKEAFKDKSRVPSTYAFLPFSTSNLGVQEQFLISEMLYEENPETRIDSFRQLTALISDREAPQGIYDFIFAFESDVPEQMNLFLEILADFVLAGPSFFEQRPLKIVNDKQIIKKLLRLQSRRETEYNTLLILNILSHSPAISRIDLFDVISNLNSTSDEKSSRLRLSIVNNAIKHGYILKYNECQLLSRYMEQSTNQNHLARYLNDEDWIACSSIKEYTAEIVLEKLKKGFEDDLQVFNDENVRILGSARDLCEIIEIVIPKILADDRSTLIVDCNILFSIVKEYPSHSRFIVSSECFMKLFDLAEEEEDDELAYASIRLLNACIFGKVAIDKSASD